VDKEVNIVYEFRHQLHGVTVSEKECIMIPKEGCFILIFKSFHLLVVIVIT